MAGGAAAYQQLRPGQDDLGRAIQQETGRQDQIRREERRKVETDRLYERQLERDAAADAATKFNQDRQTRADNQSAFEKLNDAPLELIEATGVNENLDMSIEDFNQDMVSKNAEFARLGMEAFRRGDNATYQQMQLKQKKMVAGMKMLAGSVQGINEAAAAYAKDPGAVSPVDEEYQKVMESISNNDFKIAVDDNGMPRLQVLLPDDDPSKPPKMVDINPSSFSNGKYKPYMKVNPFEMAQPVLGELQSVGEEDYDRYLDVAWNNIKSDNRTVSSLLYQGSNLFNNGVTIKKKGDPRGDVPSDAFSEEDMAIAEDFFKTTVLAMKSTGIVDPKTRAEIDLLKAKTAKTHAEANNEAAKGKADRDKGVKYKTTPIEGLGSEYDQQLREALGEDFILSKAHAVATFKDGELVDGGVTEVIPGKTITSFAVDTNGDIVASFFDPNQVGVTTVNKNGNSKSSSTTTTKTQGLNADKFETRRLTDEEKGRLLMTVDKTEEDLGLTEGEKESQKSMDSLNSNLPNN